MTQGVAIDNRVRPSAPNDNDAYYSKGSLYWSFNVEGKRRSFRRLCLQCGVPRLGVRVLDVGFGSGAMLLEFGSDCRVAGLELSEKAIERLARAGTHWRQPPDLRPWDASTLALPFESHAFDVVIMSHVLEHVPDDRALLSEARRVLVPGGHLVLMVPTEDPAWDHNFSHLRVYDHDSFCRLVASEAFTVVGTLADHSIDNVFHWLSTVPSLRRLPRIRSRLLGAVSLACTVLRGIERANMFGPSRNLGVVAVRHA
jgi:SAM-dependent methyltransferase